MAGAGSGGAAAGGGGKAGTGAGGGKAGTGAGGGSGESGRGGAGTSGGSAGEIGAAGGGEAGAAGDNGAGGSSGSAGAHGGSSSGSSGNGGRAGSGGGGTIDTCFQGLRELEGSSQVSTRENAGEQVRLRLALETADSIGTSGSYPWAPVRLALEIDGALICLDEAALAGTYQGSHHNCSDVLSFGHEGKTYEIAPPDSRALAGATLTVSSNGSVVRGPVTLEGIECVGGGRASTECRSGGPC
jgi:hypothetical protein